MPAFIRTPTYTFYPPAEVTAPFLISSPHSGRAYPADFLREAIPDSLAIRSSEDAFVDRLWRGAPGYGLPLLTARLPRAYLDLNRAAEELDAAVIEGLGRGAQNPRISSGLGVIPRVVAGGRAIYAGKLSLSEARLRIRTCWQPWHDFLGTRLQAIRARYGAAVLLDCHSMPHEATEGTLNPKGQRPQVVLGDRFGASASGKIMDQVESAFQQAGFRTSRNTPFAGAYITQRYGRPSSHIHTIQIELDRSLYMDEARIERHAGFYETQARLNLVMAILTKQGNEKKTPPLAAE